MNQLAQRTIQNLQDILEHAPAQTTDMQEFTDHWFAPGIYMRTLFIPKGFVLVGAIHRDKTLNILLKGKISVVTSSGERIVAEAPCIFTAEPGQKAGYAVEDVWYASIFPNENNVTDMEQLEIEHIAPTYKELEVLS